MALEPFLSLRVEDQPQTGLSGAPFFDLKVWDRQAGDSYNRGHSSLRFSLLLSQNSFSGRRPWIFHALSCVVVPQKVTNRPQQKGYLSTRICILVNIYFIVTQTHATSNHIERHCYPSFGSSQTFSVLALLFSGQGWRVVFSHSWSQKCKSWHPHQNTRIPSSWTMCTCSSSGLSTVSISFSLLQFLLSSTLTFSSTAACVTPDQKSRNFLSENSDTIWEFGIWVSSQESSSWIKKLFPSLNSSLFPIEQGELAL